MTSAILSVEGVEKYFGGITAVESLGFEVQTGEILGLIGPNGAGKSTTFNLIAGEYKPDAGVIKYFGEEITGLSPHKICHLGIARTYQIPQPFTKLTAFQNVMVAARFGKRLTKEQAQTEAENLLDMVGLSDKKNVTAQNLPILSLKKLELARALASDPKLLMLDEVAAGSTEKEIPRILTVIEKIRKNGTTIILVEHVMKVVMGAVDRLIVMDKGNKIAEGLPKEIMEDRRVIEAYLGRFSD